MNNNELLQTLGRNASAQTTLKNLVGEAFPALENEYKMTDAIIDKFFDWRFPYVWAEDGGSERYWRVAVESVIMRNPKLDALESFFESSGTDGTFSETYSGSDSEEFTDGRETTETHSGGVSVSHSGTDTDTYTDNHGTRTEVSFRALPSSSTEQPQNITEQTPIANKNTTTTERKRGTKEEHNDTTKIVRGFSAGKNNTTRKTTYGKTRKYSDGRTWVQVLRDISGTRSPVYDFINSFAQILLEPTCETMCCWSPSMQMSATVTELPTGETPTVTVKNVGTTANADWEVDFKLPAGVEGPAGEAATVEVGTVTTGAAGTDASVVNVGTETAAVLDFTIPKGEKGEKGDTGEDGQTGPAGEAATVEVGTVTTGPAGTGARVVNVGTETAAVLNFTIPKGEKGDPGTSGGKLYRYRVSQKNAPPYPINFIQIGSAWNISAFGLRIVRSTEGGFLEWTEQQVSDCKVTDMVVPTAPSMLLPSFEVYTTWKSPDASNGLVHFTTMYDFYEFLGGVLDAATPLMTGDGVRGDIGCLSFELSDVDGNTHKYEIVPESAEFCPISLDGIDYVGVSFTIKPSGAPVSTFARVGPPTPGGDDAPPSAPTIVQLLMRTDREGPGMVTCEFNISMDELEL